MTHSNSDKIVFWNGPTGLRWVKRQEDLDVLLRPITSRAIERAVVQPGTRIVDIGCGCGGTTIELGRLVGPLGRVLGIDVSAPMLARAAERIPLGFPVQFGGQFPGCATSGVLCDQTSEEASP